MTPAQALKEARDQINRAIAGGYTTRAEVADGYLSFDHAVEAYARTLADQGGGLDERPGEDPPFDVRGRL